MVRCIIKGNESHGTVQQEFGATQDYLYPFWLMFYLFYLSDLFEILRCPFPTVISQPMPFHILSYALSLTPLIPFSLSLSLSLSSAYSLLCFYLPLFYIKGNWLVWLESLNNCVWTNVVPHLGFAHNIILRVSLPENIEQARKRLGRDKHTSLLVWSVC